MEEKLMGLKNEALSMILQAQNLEELEQIRIQFLGKKGKFTRLLKDLPKLPPEERPTFGRLANEIKLTLEKALEEKISQLKAGGELDKEWIDVTIPGKKPAKGHLHLITQAIEEISSIFESIGFVIRRYPEVEWDWYAFGGLNMPKNHPARDEWETFFVDLPPSKKYGEAVLTPHTTSGQLREMEKVGKPPIRMLNIGKCYRRQSDVSHAPMFYQFDGLVIDKGINITHLKGTIDYFVKRYFGPDRKSRIRPFHFQFTEPSFEVDITCIICGGRGCKVCKEGWLELGGSGMVHPTVLKNGGIDPKVYTGFAWGWGVERVMMMRHGIPDIRLLFESDARFLKQF
ncbi:MAG: phenylalanine--tRNA ligase subunit alpha [bacterium]|nr:phenylalanine--tRNA ligase subunit alpha [bacterium]